MTDGIAAQRVAADHGGSRRPFARAVRTKSSVTASTIAARVIRWHIAASGAAITSHGTHSACSQRHGSWPKGT
jgi:hypothetical protein